VNFDLCLTRTRVGYRDIFVTQNLWAAVLVNSYRFHGRKNTSARLAASGHLLYIFDNMKQNGLWGNIFRSRRQEESLADILHHIPLFGELTHKELRVLEKVVHLRNYETDEPVFVETEPGAGMYIIRSGRVNVVLNFKSETPIVLAELQNGDFFGEMALLGDTARSATAIAIERSELIGFFHPDLIEIISLHPQMGAKISLGLATTLADRLRYTNEQLREIWDIRESNEKIIR
jgi:CRP-like cAMP-binding protein